MWAMLLFGLAALFVWIAPGSAHGSTVSIGPAAQGVLHGGEMLGTAANGHKGKHAQVHKEGPLAVAVSVIGIIVIIGCVVGLGSLSVRRRTRGAPPGTFWNPRGPSDRGRGLFG
jgi:hypothetical protein